MVPVKGSLKNEAIPKSVARVLNAQRIRDTYRKKRKLEEGQGRDDPLKKRQKQQIKTQNAESVSLVIQPGESLQHFNRSVLIMIGIALSYINVPGGLKMIYGRLSKPQCRRHAQSNATQQGKKGQVGQQDQRAKILPRRMIILTS